MAVANYHELIARMSVTPQICGYFEIGLSENQLRVPVPSDV